MKTVRFTQVVERSGAPELHPLWVAPEKDAEFQRAVKGGRVMTLEQANVGSKRDHGVIGYAPGGHAQFLVFPKSLKAFAGRQVVGVKYELLHDPQVKEAYHAPAAKPKKRAAPELHVKIVDDDDRETPDRKGRGNATNVVAFEHPHAEKRERAPKRTGRTERGKSPRGAAPKTTEKRLATLVGEAQRALRELKQGKAVAAYERLAAAVVAAREDT